MDEREHPQPAVPRSSADQGDAEMASLLRLAAVKAPAPVDDPIAAMLGLVPDAACRLDARRLARARRKAGLKPSALAEQMRQRGWDFTASEVSLWERNEGAAALLPPAVVQAIAETLGAEVGSLVAPDLESTRDSRLATLKRDKRFQVLAARWAAIQRISLEAAAAALESQLAIAVHRGDEPDTEQMIASLDALVRAVEQSPTD